jgi:hypothetical protein
MSAGPPPSVAVEIDCRGRSFEECAGPGRCRLFHGAAGRPAGTPGGGLASARLSTAWLSVGVVVPAVLEVRVTGRVLAPNGQDHGQDEAM